MTQEVGSLSKIKKMPSKEMLEEFLAGLTGQVTVVFDKNKGEFVKVK